MSPLSGGKWLVHHREQAGFTQEELAFKVGISPSYISAIEREEPNARDGSPRRPKVEKVDKIAKILGVSGDDARLAFGYAPKHLAERPRTIADLIERFKDLGLDLDDLEVQNFNINTPEEYNQALEDLSAAIELTLLRRRRKTTLIELEIQPDYSEEDVNEHRDLSGRNEPGSSKDSDPLRSPRRRIG